MLKALLYCGVLEPGSKQGRGQCWRIKEKSQTLEARCGGLNVPQRFMDSRTWSSVGGTV